MTGLTFINRTGRRAPVPRRALATVWQKAKATHTSLKRKNSLSLVLVAPAEARRLNKIYRQRDRPTNVLSFASAAPDEGGDIIICPALARAEAKAQGRPAQDWLVYLFGHGLLHLAGFDHRTAAEEARLERALKKLLS